VEVELGGGGGRGCGRAGRQQSLIRLHPAPDRADSVLVT
jgi:hypothetical protein